MQARGKRNCLKGRVSNEIMWGLCRRKRRNAETRFNPIRERGKMLKRNDQQRVCARA